MADDAAPNASHPSPATAPPGRRPWDGITAKIAAIIAGLLAVFIVTSTIMIVQIVQLGREPADQVALDRAHTAGVKALAEYQEVLIDFRAILLAPDAATRAAELEKYTAEEENVATLLAEIEATLPPGELLEEVKTFDADYQAIRESHDKAIADFLATGNAQPQVATLAVREEEDAALAELEDATLRMDEQRIALQEQRARDADRRAEIIVGIGLLIFLALVVAAAAVVRHIVRPIRLLTQIADQRAREQLPDTVARIRELEEGEAPPVLDPIVLGTRDETASLASAIDSLQSSAVSLAVEQRSAENESAKMLVNLGRRNQNLLNRTLAYIGELERTETDPDILERLFRLDHATTRIRRNAESMLVLAGAMQTRTWSMPAPIADVVRAALSEIEDYNRIEIYHMQEAGISGGAISDVVHLLAEILENAAHFSPPTTTVTVVGKAVPEGYRIRVIDEGIGMTQAERDAAHDTIRLTRQGQGATKLLGLYVVGRLASRRGIEVTLEPTAGRGTTANVILPHSVLAELPAESMGGTDVAGQEPHTDAIAPSSPDQGSEPVARREVDPAPTQETSPAATAVDDRSAEPAPEPVMVAGVPQRVRGAQLPDLGPVDSGPAPATVDAADVRGQLSSLQAGVQAGRQVDVADPRETEGDKPVADEPVADQTVADQTVADETVDGVPVRVRGANLSELGLADDDPDAILAPSGDANRWKLRSFQLDVDAARRVDPQSPDRTDSGRPGTKDRETPAEES